MNYYRNADHYLSQIRILNDNINIKLNTIEALKQTLSTFNSSFDFNKDVVKSSNKKDFTDVLCKINDMEESVNKDIDNLCHLKTKYIMEIAKIKNKLEVKILQERYVNLKTLNVIASEGGYSLQHIKNISKIALKKFEKIYPELFL